MARREKGAEPVEAPKLRAPPPAAPRLTSPAPAPAPPTPTKLSAPEAPPKPAPAVPTFPTPRVPQQTFNVIVCRYCGSEDVFVTFTKPTPPNGKAPFREYECEKCCLCPSCNAFNDLPKRKGRIIECRYCRPEPEHGFYFKPEHGTRFHVLMVKPKFPTPVTP